MFKLIKKYIDFIFKTDLKNHDKDYRNYCNDIDLYERCSRDPIMFMKKYFQDNMLINISLLDMDHLQLLVLDSFVNKQKIIVKAKNYNTMTQVQIILTAWLMIFYPETKIGVIVPNQILAKKYISDLQNAFNYIKREYYGDAFFEVTAQSITLTNNSHCNVKSSRDIDLNGLFRGITLDCIFYNDVNRLQCVEEIYDLFKTQYNPEYVFMFNTDSKEMPYHINPKSNVWFDTKFNSNSDLYPVNIQK